MRSRLGLNMGQNNYSKQLKLYTGELSVETQRSIQDIKALLNKRKLDIKSRIRKTVDIIVRSTILIDPCPFKDIIDKPEDNKSRNDIVMLLTTFVIHGKVLLYGIGNRFGCYYNIILGNGTNYQFQCIQ